MGSNVDVKTGAAQRRKVCNGRFRARQNNERGIPGQRRRGPHPHQLDRRLGIERVEVIEIGNVRQDRNGNPHARLRFFGRGSIERERIFGGKHSCVSEEGNEAERFPACCLRDLCHAVCKQRRIAAKLVDQEAANERGVLLRDHDLCADKARNHAAPVDIADQHDRHIRGTREPHIGDVVSSQVDFRRAACAFNEHDVGFAAQMRETLQDERQQSGLHRLVGGSLGAAMNATPHHDLRARLALRLQQHRVHVHCRGGARGTRLQRLGAADLPAVGGDGSIVGHVLRLERTHLQAAIRECTGDAGNDQRFADVRCRALKHQRTCRHIRTRCRAAPSRQRQNDALPGSFR